MTPAASGADVAFGDPIPLTGDRHGEPGVRVQRNDVAGGDASSDRLWVHAFQSAWRSDNGGADWTDEIGPQLVISGDSDMAWAYPGGPNPDRIYKTELNIACEHFLWDDSGNGGASITGWMRNDANCGLPGHDRQWIQTGPAVLPDGSILEGAEALYFIGNQIPSGGFIAKSIQVAERQPPHFTFVNHFQLLNNQQQLGFCFRGFFDVDQEDGSIHIVDCTENGPLRVYSSGDGGITWSEEQVAAHSSNTNLFPVISVDDDGGLHVVSLQSNGDLLYSYRAEDGDWGTPVSVVAGDAAGENEAVSTGALPWVDAGEGGRANIAYLATTGGPDPDNVQPPEQWHLWMSQTADGGQSWTHAQADAHAVQTGCISTAGLPLTGAPDCSNRNLVDFIGIDHLSDGNAVISYTYGCNTPTGCDNVTGQSNGAATRVVIQNSGSTIRGEGGGGQPTVTITSPEDGATVPSGVVEVSGLADRAGGGSGGGEQFTATLSGPAEVANGAAASYSVVTSNAEGDVTCTITAEGSPTRANEAPDGCSVDLSWTTDGTFTVTGEATDGTSTATDTLDVTVTTPSGIPEPDGSIDGGITIFGVNPVLAHNELIALFTSPVDPAPKFLPGEPTTFHTRFTEDSTGVVDNEGDAFTWHIWTEEGELVHTVGCTTAQDINVTTGEPDGFDCQAEVTMPSDVGRYYTTLQFDKDGRWSCHNGQPLLDVGFETGIPNCIKAFDVVIDTSTGADVVPRDGLDDVMPFLLSAEASPPKADWSIAEGQASDSALVTAASTTGERVEVFVDGTSAGSTDITTDSTNPSAQWSVPADMSGLSGEHAITARWFDADNTLLDESTITVVVEGELPPPSGGRNANGNGHLSDLDGNKITFGFKAEQKDERVLGDLRLNDKVGAVNVQINEMAAIGDVTEACGSIPSGDNALEFRGDGTFNGNAGSTFRVCVEDNGDPGKDADLFFLECLSECDYDTGSRTPDDVIDAGNIRVQSGASGGPDPSPSPTPTESPSPSPTPTESPSPSPTPTESPTPSPSPTSSPDPGCAGTTDHVWFLGIAYDDALREDFRADVRNFELFLSTLRETYCIPESQATILAMENGYTDPVLNKTYAEGSEANLKAELRRMGAEASEHPDSQFFFFLSSHGNAWSGPLGSACPATRVAMSFAALKDGGGEDGFLDDCELGDGLTDNFTPETRMFVAVDCSFCGGFSDSLTAASGTVPDGSVPTSSGVPAPNRIVITGCAITTECFGSSPAENGGVTYHHMRRVLEGEIACDGWTAPGFPDVQGFDVPVNGAPFNEPDGRCTASEWFFAAVQSAYSSGDVIGIQQQFRIKYGLDSLDDDTLIVGEAPGEPAGTRASFSEGSATSGQFSAETFFEATLTDPDGNSIAGTKLVFELSGEDGVRTFDARTDENGVASVTPTLTESPGAYQLTVRFDGDENREASADTISFVIEKRGSGAKTST